MTNAIKLPREQTSFVTPEGLLSFMYLAPGQAQKSYQEGSMAYKLEWGRAELTADDPMVKAITLVAQTYDTSIQPATIPFNGMQYPNPQAGQPAWPKHVSGPSGRLRKLEETDRDKSKYPYYKDMYVVTFSQVHSLKQLGFADKNMADPAVRMQYDAALNAKAPGAHKFANLNDPSDIARIQQLSTENQMKGLPPIPESKWAETLLPLMAHEYWPGCYGRIAGRAFWSPNSKPATVLLSFDHVLITRWGERISGGESSPDSAFAGFAPPQSMAPSGAFANPFAAQAPANPFANPFAGQQAVNPFSPQQMAPGAPAAPAFNPFGQPKSIFDGLI